MKTIGIQIKSTEAIMVVLEKDEFGNTTQTNESAKFGINDPTKPNQVRQFRDQINTAFDLIGATRIGIVARNAKGKGDRAPSPVSFKLEGIIQLYDKIEIILSVSKKLMHILKRMPRQLVQKTSIRKMPLMWPII